MQNQYNRTRFWKDMSGELEKIAIVCIKEDFPLLKHLRMLYAWRDPPHYDQKEHRVRQGEARKFPNQQRDLFGYDAGVIIAQKIWKDLSTKQKVKLIWHELRHFNVDHDDTMTPERDDNGRIKFSLERHDMDMHRFEDEIVKFGPDSEERAKLRKAYRLYKQFRAKT